MKKNIIIGVIIVICTAGYAFGLWGLNNFVNNIQRAGSTPNAPVVGTIIGFASLFILAIVNFFLRGIWQKVGYNVVFGAFLLYLYIFIKIFHMGL